MSASRKRLADIFISTYLKNSAVEYGDQEYIDLYTYIQVNNYFILYKDHWKNTKIPLMKKIVLLKSHRDLNAYLSSKLR